MLTRISLLPGKTRYEQGKKLNFCKLNFVIIFVTSQVTGKVLRPNVECTNGIIHVVRFSPTF